MGFDKGEKVFQPFQLLKVAKKYMLQQIYKNT